MSSYSQNFDKFSFENQNKYMIDSSRNNYLIHIKTFLKDKIDNFMVSDEYYTTDSLFSLIIRYERSKIYKIEVRDGRTAIDLLFDSSGNLISYENYSFELSNIKYLYKNKDTLKNLIYTAKQIDHFHNPYDTTIETIDTVNDPTDPTGETFIDTITTYLKFSESCIELEWLKNGAIKKERINLPPKRN